MPSTLHATKLSRIGQSASRLLLRSIIGADRLQQYERIDWLVAESRWQPRGFVYPNYYQRDFHGIQRGYLNPIAPLTYDAVTAWATPPSEAWVRRHLVEAITTNPPPQRILDIGCGTGSMAIALKAAFPGAEVIGLDLSPLMLALAHQRAAQAGIDILWRHGLAEQSRFPDGFFDLVSAAFLFHEVPPRIAQSILREGRRILRPKGQFVLLDGHQQRLRRLPWLMDLFREPYSKNYAAGCIQTDMQTAGFEAVTAHRIGWIHQLVTGLI